MLRRVHPKKRSVSWVNSSVSRVTGDRLYVPTACAKRVHMFKRKIAFKLLMTGGAAVEELLIRLVMLIKAFLLLSRETKGIMA